MLNIKARIDESYALTQARLARILRASDWDSKKKNQYYGDQMPNKDMFDVLKYQEVETIIKK